MIMKTIVTLLSTLLLSTSYAQDAVCECYEKQKQAAVNSPEFQECLKLHRLAEAEIDDKMEELYKSGDKAKMQELKKQPEKWRACYLPEYIPNKSVFQYQFADTYGKITDLNMDVDFTSYNKYTKDSYIEVEFADYDRMKNWQRPEGAATGSITIVKRNDSLSSPTGLRPGDYTVKSKESEVAWIFYVNYDIKGHKYSGQFDGSKPSADSNLKIITNNGRLLEFEFSLITEGGEILKGNVQVFFPFTLF